MDDTPRGNAVHAAVMIMLAPVAGVPLETWLRQDLSILRYRTGDERGLADPGPHW